SVKGVFFPPRSACDVLAPLPTRGLLAHFQHLGSHARGLPKNVTEWPELARISAPITRSLSDERSVGTSHSSDRQNRTGFWFLTAGADRIPSRRRGSSASFCFGDAVKRRTATGAKRRQARSGLLAVHALAWLRHGSTWLCYGSTWIHYRSTWFH